MKIFLIGFCLLLASCSVSRVGSAKNYYTNARFRYYNAEGVGYFIDKYNSVICYYYQDGFSCVHIPNGNPV